MNSNLFKGSAESFKFEPQFLDLKSQLSPQRLPKSRKKYFPENSKKSIHMISPSSPPKSSKKYIYSQKLKNIVSSPLLKNHEESKNSRVPLNQNEGGNLQNLHNLKKPESSKNSSDSESFPLHESSKVRKNAQKPIISVIPSNPVRVPNSQKSGNSQRVSEGSQIPRNSQNLLNSKNYKEPQNSKNSENSSNVKKSPKSPRSSKFPQPAQSHLGYPNTLNIQNFKFQRGDHQLFIIMPDERATKMVLFVVNVFYSQLSQQPIMLVRTLQAL